MKPERLSLPGLLLLSILLHLAMLASLDRPLAGLAGPTERPVLLVELGSTSRSEGSSTPETPTHQTGEAAKTSPLLAPSPPPQRSPEAEENAGLSRYREAKELEVRPKILVDSIPIDPPELRNEPAGGALILKLWISANGDVDLVRVENSSLPEVFKESAIQSFKAAKFEPGKRKGIATGAIMTIELIYRPLLKPETASPAIVDQQILNPPPPK
ncbi:MAG: TonB family protein [Rhodocyclaceae bacterium]